MLGWLLQVWNDWGMEILVLLSFGLQLLLGTLAGVRRRGWYGAYILVQFVVWVAYQLAYYTTTYALGRITFCSSWSREHQIVAFWAPFLVLHLGGPDNITAYAFEDNQLSLRLVFPVIGNILGAGYALYSFIGGAGTLVPASILMLAVGVAKYVERTCALMRANLDSIRSSFDKQQLAEADGPQTAPRCSFDEQQLAEADDPQTAPLCQPTRRLDGEDQLLLFAHSLFHVCKRAMVDSSIEDEDTQAHHGDGIVLFDYEWKDARAVIIEMELSLMYDILYTKAAVIHTWHGYGIRVISPILIAAAFLLFHIGSHDGYRRFDVIITYFLFSAAFLQEMASLLGALLSSWAVAALNASRRPGWLYRAVLCTRRWLRFRRWAKAVCYRRWPGTIGQCNLLHLCTGDTTDLSSGLPTKNLKISKEVKEMVFETIPKILQDKERRSMVTTTWGRGALDNLVLEEQLTVTPAAMPPSPPDGLERFLTGDDETREILKMALGGEFQEGILTWHIATDIYLFHREQAMKGKDNEASRVEAIRTLSNYVMFLTVERPHMVPGLVVRSLYELTCKDLAKIWKRDRNRPTESSSCCQNFCNVWLKKIFPLHMHKKLLNLYDDPNSSRQEQREQLADILMLAEKKDYVGDESVKSHLPSAVRLARRLIEVEASATNLLEVIFEVWLDMLIYAASHCNRDSHGKQLSSGGELTTVVWLMAEHAGLFRINKAKNYEKGNAPCETDTDIALSCPRDHINSLYNYLDFGVPEGFLESSAEAIQTFHEVTEEELGNSEFYEEKYFEDYVN